MLQRPEAWLAMQTAKAEAVAAVSPVDCHEQDASEGIARSNRVDRKSTWTN